MLATTSSDKIARIWDAQTGRERARLQVAHAVNTVAINPDSKWLATGSNEHVERLSDAQGSHEFLRIQFSDDPEAVIFTSKASLLVAHGKSVTLEPWRTEDLVHDLCARLNRNLTRGEWKQYLGNEPYQQTCPHLPTHDLPKGTRSE
jgi:WD40 repeat protein